MTRRGARSVLIFVGSLALAGPAWAAESASAQVLFEEGRRLMAAGRLDEACPKLAESQKLDPGAGTLLNLAACYEKGGRFASAWATYIDAASFADRSSRLVWKKRAREKAASLKPHLSTITIVVPAESRVDGLEIVRDGATVMKGEIGIKVPVDGGEHTIVVSAPKHRSFEAHVTARSRDDALTVTVPALERVADAPEPAVPVAPLTPAPASVAPAAPPESRGGTQRTIGIVTAAAGVAAVGLGGYFSLQAMSKHDDARPECSADETTCNGRGLTDYRSAVDSANGATIALAVGGALLVGGIVLWLTAPRGTVSSSAARTVPLTPGISF